MLKLNREISNDQAHRPHQNIQGREKDDSSNSISHEECYLILIRVWKILNVLMGTRILIQNSIWGSNHYWFPLIHEGWRDHLIGRKDFHNFHLTRRISSKRGHGKLWDGEFFLVYIFGKGGKWMSKKINLLCVKNCYSWKQMVCKQKTWKKVVCNK